MADIALSPKHISGMLTLQTCWGEFGIHTSDLICTAAEHVALAVKLGQSPEET